MKVYKAIRNGISLVFENYKMIVIIYIVNICAALLLTIPFFSALRTEIGFKGVREDLATGFNYDWWSALKSSPHTFLDTIRPTLDGGFTPIMDNFEMFLTGHFSTFGILVLLLILVYVSITAFFNGGVLGLYADDKRNYTTGRFFSFSGAYFHHFMSLVTSMVFLLFLFYKILYPLVFNTIDSVTASWMNETAVWWTNLVGFVLVAVLLILFRTIFDYAKVILVVESKESSWLCIWLAIKFIFGHPLKTLGLISLLLLIGAGIMLVFGGIMSVINPTGIYVLLVLVVFQQFFIFLKIGHRLLILGAQLSLYQQRVAIVVPSKKKRKVK